MGSTPVAPAFGTPLVSVPSAAAAGSLEVRREVVARLYGDYAPALRPDLLEEGQQPRHTSDPQLRPPPIVRSS